MTTGNPKGNGMKLEVGPGAVEFEIDELGFLPGMYHISATIVHAGQALGSAIDYQNQCLTLRVDAGTVTRGNFFMPHRWRPAQAVVKPSASHELPVR